MENTDMQEDANNASNGCPEESILLRRESGRVRENRTQSREHTPSALVSHAFGFLKEDDDLQSTIDAFGSLNADFVAERSDYNQSDQIRDLISGVDSVNENAVFEDISDIQRSVCIGDCKSKDSGFASLERHCDIKFQRPVDSGAVFNCDEDGLICVKTVPSQNENTECDIVSCEKSSESFQCIDNELKSEHIAYNENKDTQQTDFSYGQTINERVNLAIKVLDCVFNSDEDSDEPTVKLKANDEDNLPDSHNELEKTNFSETEDVTISTLTSSLLDETLKDELVTEENIGTEVSKNSDCKVHTVNDKILDISVQDNGPDIESGKILSNNILEFQEVSENVQTDRVLDKSKVKVEETLNHSSSLSDQTEAETKLIKIERAQNDNASSDDSSDEETGIYAESFRRSNWIRVSKEGKLQLHIPTPPPDSATKKPDSATDSTTDSTTSETMCDSKVKLSDIQTIPISQPDSDDVFVPMEQKLQHLMHKRSDSLASTASEVEFKRKYVSRRKCLIQRADSQQEYHRLSARIYDKDKEVILERNSDCQDLGLHLLDSHPAFITSVDPDSPAEKAGIVEGQILVSVNDYSVLTTDHADIIELIQKSQGSITLGVANSDFQPVRDLQAPVLTGYLYKLGQSMLVRLWKKRYFILRQDNCLYYYKNEQESDPLGALPLCGYTISRHTETNKDYCFKAEKYGARSYFFMTDNRDQMTEWVGAMTQAAMRSKKRKESFLSVSSHNVSLPALDIRRPECSGFLYKMVHRSWNKRYCVLKDACIYYYKDVNSLSALGVAHLHGYTVDVVGHPKKKNSFLLIPPDAKMRGFNFAVDNDTDKKRWVEALIHSIQRWVKVDA